MVRPTLSPLPILVALFFNLAFAQNPAQVPESPVRVVRRPDAPAIPRLSEADAVAGLRDLIDTRVSADRFAGAVLIAKDGQVVFEGAYGLADRATGIPNTLDTRFGIGSMNKMFTAVSILQLVQAGRVNLTDPLGTYLDDYPNDDVAEQVTIHHLLTHTGGTGDIFSQEYLAVMKNLRVLDDYMSLIGERDLAFEPGERWEYSNYGFILLGIVIERVTGESYYDYVQENVYDPADMASSGSEPEDQRVESRSVGYMKPRGSDAWEPNTDWMPYRGNSAGGGYSTIGDLLRFAEALKNQELLDAYHTNLMLIGQIDTARGSKQAYGLQDSRRADGAGAVGHGGGAPGINGNLKIYPKSGYVTVVLANLSPPAATELSNYLDSTLPIR
jgi:CubicO group peptidase (beta-lactamase class C family)